MSSYAVLTIFTRVSGSSVHVTGKLVDPVAVLLGQNQQLSIEEPSVIEHQGRKVARGISADRLEAALGVPKPHEEHRPDYEVVASRDHLALE